MLCLAFILITLSVVVNAGLADEILSALENTVTCSTCHTLLIPLKTLSDHGDSTFVNALTDLCVILKVQDKDVCEGLLNQQGPILARDLRAITHNSHTATKLCNAAVGLCKEPVVHNPTIPFPTESLHPSTSSSRRQPFQVVHFSDVHIDREYVPGSEAQCTKPICCRNYSDTSRPIKEAAGPFGNIKCDSPSVLIDSLLDTFDARFSLFTGDVVEAAVWLVTKDEVTSDLVQFNEQYDARVGSTIFPVVGNHDVAPVNSFPRSTAEGYANASQWVFDILSEQWKPWISETATNQVVHTSGSYSIIPQGTNLRIISLNTVYWYKLNLWLYDSLTQQPDPNGIIAFAAQELQAAEEAGQRAWIIGHMPPGCADTHNDQSAYFDQVVQRYYKTIAGQFYGHTHKDEMEIAYSNYTYQVVENAVSLAWIAPAVTPRSGNPAFKIYDVDPDTYEIMDAKVYYSDMSDPEYQTNPTWKLYYSVRETYAPLVNWSTSTALSPAFWHEVSEVFLRNDTAFQMYNTFKTRGVDVPECEGECRMDEVCNIRAMRSEFSCDTLLPGFSYKARREEQDTDTGGFMGYPPHCEAMSIGHLLRYLPGKLNETRTNDPETWSKLRRKLNATIPDGILIELVEPLVLNWDLSNDIELN